MPSPRTDLNAASEFAMARNKWRQLTFPSREVGPLEEGMLEDPFDTSKSGNHIDSVIVELP